MPRLSSTKRTKEILTKKGTVPMRKRTGQINPRLVTQSKMDDHPLSQTFCSFWSSVVVARHCKATRPSSSSCPLSRHLFVPSRRSNISYRSVDLCPHRSFYIRTRTSPPVHSSLHSGPLSMGARLVPLIALPNLLRSFRHYSNVPRLWCGAYAVPATTQATVYIAKTQRRPLCVRSIQGYGRRVHRRG
jgi:hypothetical protein